MIRIILLKILSFSLLMADGNWKLLKELNNHPSYLCSDYKSSDYHIRNDIDYFELRHFLFYNGEQLSDKYKPSHRIYKKRLSDYSRKLISDFEQLPFSETKEGAIHDEVYSSNFYGGSPFYLKANGFFIKKDNSLWIINEKKDLLWVFNGIDTEAELATFLWLYDDYDFNVKYEYREIINGYEVKKTESSYPQFDEKRKESYIVDNIFLFTINHDGKYSKVFLNTKKRYLGQVIPTPIPPRDLPHETKESILNGSTFISPTKFFFLF